MLLRHFLLEETTKNKEMDTLPVIILLREFNAENPDISVMILNAIQKIAPSITGHVLIETLIAGKAKLLFDGIDEIRERDIGVLIEALERFVLLYPENQFIVTSRKYSSFVELNQFVVFQVMPLSKSQALSLISRLEYMPESPGIKADFMFRLENEYYRTHEEFASNPLLLTLMLLTFHRFSRLPHKKYIFYEEAYATLLQGHDSHNKPGFQREYLSVDEPSEFTFVFRELCARSYREADYEFNRRKMEQYFALLWSAKELQSQQITSSGRAKMSFPHFLTDSTKNTGLLFEEGGIIYFLHRSFQEYFFADYYARTDDASLLRLGRFLQQPNQSDFDEGEAFEMLYDMSKNKVERFIFLPYLTTLLDKKTEKEAYWSFLSSGFNYLHYRVQNNVALDQYFPKSTGRRTPFVIQFLLSLRSTSKVLSWIINAAKIKLESTDVVIDKQSIDEESFCHSSFQQTNFYIQHGTAANSYHIQTVPTRVAVPERQKETYVLDSNNDLVSFGGDYHFPCSFGTNNFSGHYSEIIEAVEAPKFPLWKVFQMLNDYFHTIKKRYEHAGDIDLSI